jgi:hypothetical protein
MFRNRPFSALIAALTFAFAANVTAQSAGPAASPVSSALPVEAPKPTLRVQIVISRYEGEKKLGSLPYTFTVTPNPSQAAMTRIRFGVDAPVPVTYGNDLKSGPVEYKTFGTNIDCNNVKELSGGRYQFDINLQNTTALPGAPVDGKESRPLFRRFEAAFTAVLRDGQSMQSIASTNPVTGEVVKIDVTLNVVK